MTGKKSDSDQDPRFDLLMSPGHLLRRNHQRSYEIFTQFVGSGVTRQQIALLISARQCPGASQNDLVARTGFDKSTLKEMLGRMVSKGWIERERDPVDSRAWRINITDAGDRLLGETIAKVRAAQSEILAPLPPDLRPIFLRCLRIMIGLEKA